MSSYHSTFRMAAKMEMPREKAANIRIRHLKKRKKSFQKFLTKNLNPISLATALKWIKDCDDEISYLEEKKTIIFDESTEISDAQIQEAKAYPIDRIIDFQNGKAIAWCHNDSKPSLTHWKQKNMASCFVCNERFDTIDAVMELQGLTFPEAVRSLT